MKSAYSNTEAQMSIYTVIGADSYLGSHMKRHLQKIGQSVDGFGQNEDFTYETRPIDFSKTLILK